MKKAIPKTRGGKRPGAGRPATGRDPVSAIRLPEDLTSAIDRWSEVNKVSSRSEAIRRLIEVGLATSPKARRSPEATAKAKQMAAQEIDRVEDRGASSEDRQTRKRRLLKGPEEFREMRTDHTKPKG